MITYLLLGTNLGDREENLEKARELISTAGSIITTSSIYETAAWGITDQPLFLNQVVALEAANDPNWLLPKLQKFEQEIGRIRTKKWGSRLIDIDILYHDSQIITSNDLSVPHPEIQNRRFTLLPLQEIAPDFIHPVLLKSTTELLALCHDHLEVKVLSK